MKTLAEQMSIYQDYHTKEITKITHYFGVPCIILAVQIFLSWFHINFAGIFTISLAWLAVIALVVYYFILDVTLAIAAAMCLIILTFIGQMFAGNTFHFLGVLTFFVLFIGGWIIQFVGHYFEDKKPAFTENLLQIFIAPIFLIAEAFFACGFKKKLQQKIINLAAAG
jgi:uncharacterized membrane protein YGL010W